MGAFGNLLQQYFGGTRHDVSTWGNVNKKKKEKLRCEICGRFAKILTYMPYLKKYACDKHDSSTHPIKST